MTSTAFPANETTTNQPVGFDARVRRVLELRELVRQGRYVPNPHEVAAAILGEWLATQSEVEPPDPPANKMWRFIVPPAPATTHTENKAVARTA